MVVIKPADRNKKHRLTRAKSNIGPDGGGFEYQLIQTFVSEDPENSDAEKIEVAPLV